jgi:hypothetical protein
MSRGLYKSPQVNYSCYSGRYKQDSRAAGLGVMAPATRQQSHSPDASRTSPEAYVACSTALCLTSGLLSPAASGCKGHTSCDV